MMPTTDRSNRSFWERRLDADWTASGVGYQALGRAFNNWIYRIRRELFLQEVAALGLDLDEAEVLDVGSGTGFYVRGWQHAGVRSITGCDLTDAAVTRLRASHPGVRIERADISAADDVFGDDQFDAVSCIDVLFHIVSDDRYRRALETMHRVLKPGGWLILSENFLHRAEQRGPNQVNRTLPWITDALTEAGFEIVRRRPMQVLMNAQVDAPWLWRKAWGGFLRAATLTKPTGYVAGAALYPIERQLVRRLSESPTVEMMTCRRSS
jgi:SAM-dependent methyltransferase